ncbi:amidophosphoribosyltransferase [Pseudomonas brassicacearum]|uniref:Amidophosphoribosyltransferase n=1 Tax=Pseudomonas brassicacearum TaxID=930166 RepID=A0A423H4H4_9PSED|nr:ComF family protein [Pseudomonas brassicacearum]RON07526.1 amidophosphoribosyltransferase [Pseudomonas brassicacearum]
MRCQPRYKGPVYIWLKNEQCCLLCDELSDTPQPICTSCETELPWLGDHCQVCALPLPVAGLTCGQCLQEPPAFEQVIAPWTYSFPLDSLITRFKHTAKWPYGRLLAELLAQSLQHRFDEGLKRPDALVPVPLARKRLRERGYNQAAMLARWLSDSLQIRCDENLLLRTQDTTAQQDLDAKARKQNLLRAFALMPEAQIKGRHLALVDDVLTTGATAQSLARLLIGAGAARVDVYCLARTPKPGELT